MFGEREGDAVGKSIEITRSSPNWARSSAVICRAMWGGAPSSMNTVVSRHCLMWSENDVLLKDIAVTWTRDETPLRTMRIDLLRGKRTKNKISYKTTPYSNVIRMQRTLMHKIRTYITAYATISTIYCSVQRKMGIVGPQKVLGLFTFYDYSSQKIGCKIKTFSGFAV